MSQRGGIILRMILLLGFVVFLFFLYLIRHPILRAAGQFWIVEEAPQTSDVIIVLSDDNYWADRATHAANLYRDGWAPKVVASGRFLRPYATIAELMEKDLTARGVPQQNIILLTHHSDSTFEEALALRGLIAEHGWKKILLVTSNYHSRRARHICSRLFPRGTELRVMAARDKDFDPETWWYKRTGRKLFLHETLGMLWALWEVRYRSTGKEVGFLLPAPASRDPKATTRISSFSKWPLRNSPLTAFDTVYTSLRL
jgi:uncharacterized SAM-binding protein YcdF (DUF218 family)